MREVVVPTRGGKNIKELNVCAVDAARVVWALILHVGKVLADYMLIHLA
jgi:hypothetical protein